MLFSGHGDREKDDVMKVGEGGGGERTEQLSRNSTNSAYEVNCIQFCHGRLLFLG